MNKQKYIIDSHVHVGVCPRISYFAEDLIERMNKTDQDMAVVFPMMRGFEFGPPRFNYYAGNDYIAEVQKMYPNRIIGIAGIDPRYQINRQFKERLKTLDHEIKDATLAEIERAILELGLRGIKLHPFLHTFPINDPILMPPVFDKLVECQEKVGRKLYNVIHAWGDSAMNTPEKIAWVAERYPQLTFALAHIGISCGWGVDAYLEILAKYENLILDFTYGPEVRTLREVAKKIGTERIVDGSNEHMGAFEAKMGTVDLALKTDYEKEMVLGGTLAQLLEIPQRPVS